MSAKIHLNLADQPDEFRDFGIAQGRQNFFLDCCGLPRKGGKRRARRRCDSFTSDIR